MEIHLRTIVIDAIFSQPEKTPFDCITLMRYIRDNEIQGKTIPHQEIAIYLDALRTKGIIERVDSWKEFTEYQWKKTEEKPNA